MFNNDPANAIQTGDTTAPSFLDKAEGVLENVIGTLDVVGTIVGNVAPNAAPVVEELKTLGSMAETALHAIDPAGMAAAQIASASDPESFHQRLLAIESQFGQLQSDFTIVKTWFQNSHTALNRIFSHFGFGK